MAGPLICRELHMGAGRSQGRIGRHHLQIFFMNSKTSVNGVCPHRRGGGWGLGGGGGVL